MRISDWSSDVCSSDLRQVTAFFRRRRWLTALLVLSLLMVGTAAWLFANARAMPVVRRLDVALPFPADAPRRPVTVALLTDSHLSGPDNSPERMARIVALVNGLRPDLIVLGGDDIGGRTEKESGGKDWSSS